MKVKKSVLKGILVVLLVILVIAALFLAVNYWEKRQSPAQTVGADVVHYKGSDYVLKNGLETFLVIGVDKFRDSEKSASHESGTLQADFLMLFVFDNDKKETTAIHINRDTMTKVNRLDVMGNTIGSDTKQIALAYNYAYSNEGKVNCRNTADAVSGLLKDVKVNHYISVTMDAVPVVNDAVGGVPVKVLDDFAGVDDTLKKGETVTLKGEQALTYVRSREQLPDKTNLARMERQRQYLDALVEKATGCMKEDGEFSLKLAEKLGSFVAYDSTESRLQTFAKKFDQYTFLGVKEIEGTAEVGEEFMEFTPDEASLEQTVMDVFYKPKKG